MAIGNAQSGAVRPGKKKRRGADLFDLRNQYGTATQSVMDTKAQQFAREQFDWQKSTDLQNMALANKKFGLDVQAQEQQTEAARKATGGSIFSLGTQLASSGAENTGTLGWDNIGGSKDLGSVGGWDLGSTNLGSVLGAAGAGYGFGQMFGSEDKSDIENFGYGAAGGLVGNLLSGSESSGILDMLIGGAGGFLGF